MCFKISKTISKISKFSSQVHMRNWGTKGLWSRGAQKTFLVCFQCFFLFLETKIGSDFFRPLKCELGGNFHF